MLTIEGTSLARENLGKRPDRIRALSRALEHSKRNWMGGGPRTSWWRIRKKTG